MSDKADAPVASTKRLGENQSGRLDGRRVTFATSIGSGRAEELLWRLADNGNEIVDHVGLVSKAAGICDIRPGRSTSPHGQDLLDACDACKLLRTSPEHRPKAARQMSLPDVQLRCKPPHAQRGTASQTLRSPAHDRVRLALTQVPQQETFDAREPRGAVRSLHQHFFQQGHHARIEKITQVNLFIDEFLHLLANEAGGGFRLEANDKNAERPAWPYRHDARPACPYCRCR